jgi:transposase
MEEAALKNTSNLPTMLMFQDEARFGRMSDPKACWAPAPLRPVVKLALVREYQYIFGATAPQEGRMDYMVAPNMKTENMTRFLRQVSRAHKDKFVIMVVDGASSHKAKALVIPDNVALILLPPYSPELNPQERVWSVVRKGMANRYFETLDEAIAAAKSVLRHLKRNKKSVINLTCWPWISLILNKT